MVRAPRIILAGIFMERSCNVTISVDDFLDFVHEMYSRLQCTLTKILLVVGTGRASLLVVFLKLHNYYITVIHAIIYFFNFVFLSIKFMKV